jgi:hypothetical protein
MTKRFASPFALSLVLLYGSYALAQEAPAKPQSKEPTKEQVKEQPEQKPAKPEPERKGGIQNAEATEAKGSTTNLGTDVAAVRQSIENALHNDPTLSGSAFTINVSDDTVEITGLANSGKERTAARRIVQSFAGNLRVKDRITVAGAPAPPSADQPADAVKKNPPMAEAENLAKPESDETQAPAKKANKPKKEPAKDGDKATEDPRDPRKN